MALAEHELVKCELNQLLVRALPEGFLVLNEAMHRIGDRTDRIPDLAIWRRTDLKRMDPQRTIVGGPLIAIEVVSSESARELEEKTEQYFAAGTEAVWVVYPRTRGIHVERPSGAVRLGVKEVLRAPEISPDFAVPVAAVFGLLDEE